MRSSDKKLFGLIFFVAIGFYCALGYGVGAGALDSDTFSLVLAWRLIRQGLIVEYWKFATPKFLPVVVDGTLYELAGEQAVLARGLLVAAAMAAGSALFLRRVYSGRTGLRGWGPALVAAWFLLFHRFLPSLVFGGNSTLWFAAFLVMAAVAFLGWPSSRATAAGLLLLFAAALTRTEGVAYLAVAVAVTAAIGRRSRRRQAFGTAAAAAVLLLAAWAADLYVPTTLSGKLRSSRDVTREANDRFLGVVAATNESHAGLAPYRRIEESYVSNLSSSLRLQRPVVFWLLTAAGGLWWMWKQSRPAAWLLLLMGVTPLVYGWLIHWSGLALFPRFFLPTAVALVIASANAYFAAWSRLEKVPAKRVRRAGRLAVAALAIGVMALGVRDAWNTRRGYLRETSENLRGYRQGLSHLRGIDLRQKRLLVPGVYFAVTNLELETNVNGVFHVVETLAAKSPAKFLARFDYVLYGSGNPSLEQLFQDFMSCEQDSCRLEVAGARFESFWISPDGRFKFFSKASSSSSDQGRRPGIAKPETRINVE